MSKRTPWILAALFALTPLTALAQQPDVYVFVAEWTVARDKWPDVTTFFEKTTKPIFEKLVADGTLVSYGSFETIVHEDEGITHGTWWSATSVTGIEKARLEALKAPPSPAMVGAKHHDLWLRSVVGNRKPASGNGYLAVNIYPVQPGKTTTWRQLWEKYNKPLADAAIANGTIVSYDVELQQVITQDSNLRFVVYVAPSADALDKFRAQQLAEDQKRTQAERDTIALQFREVLQPGATRGYFARITSFATK